MILESVFHTNFFCFFAKKYVVFLSFFISFSLSLERDKENPQMYYAVQADHIYLVSPIARRRRRRYACLPCLTVDSRHVVLCFAVDFAKVDFAKAWLRARACERVCVCERKINKNLNL